MPEARINVVSDFVNGPRGAFPLCQMARAIVAVALSCRGSDGSRHTIHPDDVDVFITASEPSFGTSHMSAHAVVTVLGLDLDDRMKNIEERLLRIRDELKLVLPKKHHGTDVEVSVKFIPLPKEHWVS